MCFSSLSRSLRYVRSKLEQRETIVNYKQLIFGLILFRFDYTTSGTWNFIVAAIKLLPVNSDLLGQDLRYHNYIQL